MRRGRLLRVIGVYNLPDNKVVTIRTLKPERLTECKRMLADSFSVSEPVSLALIPDHARRHKSWVDFLDLVGSHFVDGKSIVAIDNATDAIVGAVWCRDYCGDLNLEPWYVENPEFRHLAALEDDAWEKYAAARGGDHTPGDATMVWLGTVAPGYRGLQFSASLLGAAVKLMAADGVPHAMASCLGALPAKVARQVGLTQVTALKYADYFPSPPPPPDTDYAVLVRRLTPEYAAQCRREIDAATRLDADSRAAAAATTTTTGAGGGEKPK